MKSVEIQKSENMFYGMRYSRHGDEVIIEDYFPDELIKLPFGETLFSIVEASEFLKNLNGSDNEQIRTEVSGYFEDKKYDITDIICRFPIITEELNRLEKIKTYLGLFADGKMDFNLFNFQMMTSNVFLEEDCAIKDFSIKNIMKFRSINSKTKIPLAVSTKYISNTLKEDYFDFSFYTSSEYHSLSELCILSIYEILSLGLKICKCKMCERFFAGDSRSKYCKRPLITNDYRGCIDYRMYLYTVKNNNQELLKKYKTVLARLAVRAKKNSFSNIRQYNDFRSEWKVLRQEVNNGNKDPDALIEFLNSERWK